MSDRDCNLVSYMKLWREEGGWTGNVRVIPEPTERYPSQARVVDADGNTRRICASLPSPAHCGAFGGICEC